MSYLFAILLLIAPLYVWRFSIGGLPTNFLMIASLVIVAVAAIRIWREHNWSIVSMARTLLGVMGGLGRPMLIGVLLIGAASFVALAAYGITAEKLAQWVVLYLIPLLVFVLIRYQAAKDSAVLRQFRLAAYWLLLGAGLLALVQFFTLATLPPDWWGNANEPKRAIAFFAHPNAYALFVTPIVAWLIPDVVQRLQRFWSDRYSWFYIVAWLVGAFGLFLSLSRGAWIGIVAAAAVYVLLSANKKMFLTFGGLLLAAIIVVAAVPNLRYRLILPFYGEKSAVARLSLWETGGKMLADNPPVGYILGKGIHGFNNNWDQYNADPNLEHYNFPHNIFLNFWIDLGLLGLFGMLLVMVAAAWHGFKNRKKPIAMGLLLFLVAMVVHGLIDIPYLKNDLALAFWMVLGLSFWPIANQESDHITA